MTCIHPAAAHCNLRWWCFPLPTSHLLMCTRTNEQLFCNLYCVEVVVVYLYIYMCLCVATWIVWRWKNYAKLRTLSQNVLRRCTAFTHASSLLTVHPCCFGCSYFSSTTLHRQCEAGACTLRMPSIYYIRI